jgi:membrane associated rhomboid family serine protease
MPPRFNIPPITRIVLITLVAQSLLSAAIRYREWTERSDVVVPYLTLVPQLSLIYPWTFLTTALVESNVFTLGITAVTIFYGGRYLERAWTSAEFAKFLVVVSLVPNVLCFLILVSLYALSGNMTWTCVSSLSTWCGSTFFGTFGF